MRGIKRSCAFLLALCIIFTGCGKKAESKSETSETSETTTVSEIETTTSETSAKTEGSASYADTLSISSFPMRTGLTLKRIPRARRNMKPT